jgi:hypothetical protein
VPSPVAISGSGDDIVDLENPFPYGIVHITGNKGGRYFAITNYGADNEEYDLLVIT